MFHPTRGGVRGGKDQFNWENVKTDKDRECYLGHSLMAPVGRWQDGKDLTWYVKDKNSEKKSSEFFEAKELEEKALMSALGYTTKQQEFILESQRQNKITSIQEKKEIPRDYFSENCGTSEVDRLIVKLVKKYGEKDVYKILKKMKKKK